MPHADTPPVRWALAGYGSGGRVFHAPLITSAPGIELVAVVTTDEQRRASVGADLGVPCVRTVEELPALGVAAVTISTPPASHTDLAHRCLDAGMDVVLDKPFALTAADAAELVRHGHGADRLLIPYQNRRWDGDYLTVGKLAAAGALGRVHTLTSRIDRFRPVKPGWAAGTPAQGAGILLDLGPHLIDQALRLLGPAEAASASLRTIREGAGAEDDMELELRHASGAHSRLVASMAAAAPGPRFLVNGTTAGYRVHGFDVQEAQLKSGERPATLGDGWGAVPTRDYGVLFRGDQERERRIPTERGRWDTFYPAAAQAVRREGPAPVAAMDAVATARVIDAARRSAAEGITVAVKPAAGAGE